ncbi:uncharacterized protein LOC141535187 [Cotesia typhae]|uniref:uncharacterized protein LOC141535187 n=1 Tax=Cotesia typhae TaxID=2053667 RepID=UPI003D68B01B
MSEDITQKNAQYCKKYYARKKSANQEVVKKKTNSEKCRQYRQRQKLLKQQFQSENDVIHTPSTSSLQMTFEPQPISTDSISSTSVHNTHNCITVQVEVHMENSPVPYEYRSTSNNISSVEKYRDSRSRQRENNQHPVSI